MRTKKVKPPQKKFDYVMHISTGFDQIMKKEFVSFKIQTTKEFLTFRYQLKINTELKENKITFNIIGFIAPKGELSNPGFAEYEYRLYDFNYDDYVIVIERKDSGKIKFNMKIKKSPAGAIALRNIPRDSFIEIKP